MDDGERASEPPSRVAAARPSGRGHHPVPGSSGLVIEVQAAPGTLTPPESRHLADLCARLAPVASAVLHARGEARVRVLADGPMAQAHEQYTGIPGPTDVLTFDLSDHDADGPVTGPVTIDADVLVCADEARRQAADLGHDVARELVLYVLHAVLHCCGHDDHDEASFARMHALEDTILTQAGIGATFVPPARPGIGGGS